MANPFYSVDVDAIERWEKAIQEAFATCYKQKVNRDRYPHDCPKCKAPAYIGFASVDCSAKCK